jgi:hypothetical protein
LTSFSKQGCRSYLRDAANVLDTVLVGEAEVLVEAEADVVAVEAVGVDAEVEEVLLESSGYSRLAGRRKTGKPDCQTTLAIEMGALAAGEGRVPGDVAISQSSSCVSDCLRGFGR